MTDTVSGKIIKIRKSKHWLDNNPLSNILHKFKIAAKGRIFTEDKPHILDIEEYNGSVTRALHIGEPLTLPNVGNIITGETTKPGIMRGKNVDCVLKPEYKVTPNEDFGI